MIFSLILLTLIWGFLTIAHQSTNNDHILHSSLATIGLAIDMY